MIKNVTSFYYDGKDNGIILDDAYDLYKRSQYIKYVKEHSINYLRCQDVDMNLLTFFPEIEFITVPEDAEHLENIYKLRKLKGLEIAANKLKLLDLSGFSNLEYLIVHDYSNGCNLSLNCNKLKHLFIIHSNITDLNSISINCNLESLHLEFCYNLKTLDGIRLFGQLKRVILDYCLKLKNISDLKFFANSLKCLRITDCNKINELSDTLSELLAIESIHLSTSQTNCVNKLPSVCFVDKLVRLKSFLTDYQIEDGDLKPLLKIKEVDILKFYKSYNLQKASFK